MIKVLFRNSDFVCIEKESGWHVHPPENPQHFAPKDKIILHQLRRQLGQFVYPVHRLDVGTFGVMVMALSSEAARDFGQIISAGELQKHYQAVVRGWTPDSGRIEIALPLDSTSQEVPAETHFSCIAQIELPNKVGKRHSTARYSLVNAVPITGRFHQIRRHMARINHPLIGDAVHGDSHHNRFFRDSLGLAGLCLWADKLSFNFRGEAFCFESQSNEKWQKLQTLFKIQS